MPSFSDKSWERLSTCDASLVVLFNEVIKIVDCTILCGHRDKKDQTEAFEAGRSKLPWPKGMHNSWPSKAVDAAPYPIVWEDISRFYYFGGIVLGVAAQLKIPLRWGGDWDRDHDLKDQSFNDLVHFELVG